jgi:hypothetical protein
MRIALAIITLAPCIAFAPPNNIAPITSSCLAAKNDMPTPLATDGDWSAYLDEETTGYGEFKLDPAFVLVMFAFDFLQR